ncbi:4-hydroxybenzoate polyprenyltransferase, mitochondrial [Quillaja saponaria]|uniref:4-hydroxybenzoate polyprenyltransferase, mitochondrial n=1 Tax=Quillaja saponaria TaxID=32244 RepID=A0AAD7LLW3_QUISA|nr:4-hydroxybenzoate polyprenyltransferase, mitochondrial [Quillaja saponaria]
MSVKSVPVLLCDSSRNWMAGFGVACIASLALCCYNAQIGWPYFVSLAAAFAQLAWQIFAVDLSSPADYKAKFHSNKWFPKPSLSSSSSSSRVFPNDNRNSIYSNFHPLKHGKEFREKNFNSISCTANHSSSFPIVDEKISSSSSPNVNEEILSSPSLIVDENNSSSSSSSPIVEEKISWVDKYLPEPTRPYARLARLDMPVGIGLSCSATMTVNDILDYDIDKKISRTKSRPIANGDITPFQGVCLLALEILLGVGILFPFMNNYSRLLVIPFLFLMCTYPLMKRITYWPQAYLGLNLSWGALIGWAAMKGSCDWKIVLPLYRGGVFWTLVYETIYGHQDKEEDIKMGEISVCVVG